MEALTLRFLTPRILLRYLVFEWADMDCHKLIHSPQFLTGRHIQSFAYQLLKGVKFLQSANVIHRDLKPASTL